MDWRRPKLEFSDLGVQRDHLDAGLKPPPFSASTAQIFVPMALVGGFELISTAAEKITREGDGKQDSGPNSITFIGATKRSCGRIEE